MFLCWLPMFVKSKTKRDPAASPGRAVTVWVPLQRVSREVTFSLANHHLRGACLCFSDNRLEAHKNCPWCVGSEGPPRGRAGHQAVWPHCPYSWRQEAPTHTAAPSPGLFGRRPHTPPTWLLQQKFTQIYFGIKVFGIKISRMEKPSIVLVCNI